MLLDEPFGALDPLTRAELHREFRRIQDRLRKTVIIYPSTVSCTADCAVERLGQVLYIDDNHLSRAGLNLLKPLLDGVFDEAGGEPRVVVAR